jgi:hypothetical protein
MKTDGMLTKLGRVDWNWDGKAMLVKIEGKRVPVRLGSGFPAGARVSVLSIAADRRKRNTE